MPRALINETSCTQEGVLAFGNAALMAHQLQALSDLSHAARRVGARCGRRQRLRQRCRQPCLALARSTRPSHSAYHARRPGSGSLRAVGRCARADEDVACAAQGWFVWREDDIVKQSCAHQESWLLSDRKDTANSPSSVGAFFENTHILAPLTPPSLYAAPLHRGHQTLA